jgi:site-specific recombinase
MMFDRDESERSTKVGAGAVCLSFSQKLSWMETMVTRARSPRKQGPSWQRDFIGSVLRTALIEGVSSPLFEVGIPRGKSAFRETLRRMKNSFEAPGYEARDLRGWLLSVVREEDLEWLREMPEQTYEELMTLIESAGTLREGELTWLRRSMADAVFSLSLDISTLMAPGKQGDIVIGALDFQIACRRMHTLDERLQSAAENCVLVLNDYRERNEEPGTERSEYDLDRIRIMLDRMESLVALLSVQDASALPAMVRGLVLSLVQGSLADRDFKASFRNQSTVVSHKIAERMGVIGENYIARSTKEYFQMIWHAGGAGFITAGTIVAKFAMASMSANIFMGGTLASLNYVASFLIMQVFGFRLATKQPSLTASTLIHRLTAVKTHSQKALAEVADDIAVIARSQVAAALGNFGFVISATIVFHFVYRWVMGAGFISDSTAHHALSSLNPFNTLTIPFAFFTGVLLWLSTLLAGLVESRAIEAGYADRGSKALFGVSSCVFLGILLAATPVLGSALGFPLDVRHFTLSTGSLTLAVCSLGFGNAIRAGLLSSFIGVLIIGVLNFGVSFILSLIWSAFVRGVRRAHLTQVFTMALRFRGFPSHFFLPSGFSQMGFSERR